MKSRRGITTIVATVFLIAVVVASLTYITYSLELMANFSEQLVTEEVRKKNVQDEAFELVFVNMTDAATPTVFKLDATIQNTGEIPLKITTLWLDKQNENDVVRKIPIDLTIAPGRTFNLIDESIDIDVDSDAGYSMKFITTRGETQTFYLNSAGTESLDIQAFAIPNSVPTGFDTTFIMTVVNNMTNNRELHNLVPTEPICDTDCTKLNGPNPESFPSLKPGDVATFRWDYRLSGDIDDTFTFTGSLVGGLPENIASDTVTIGNILEAELAGQSISAVGFGAPESAPGVFVLHTENNGIPPLADYQMSLGIPDSSGTFQIFDDAGDIINWFSANATISDVHIPEGNWNASLRYNSPRLPSGMAAAASTIHDDNQGHTLHFNTDSSLARKDSGQISACTDLVDSGTLFGATWSATGGYANSGAYYFDGSDYITITNDGSKGSCNYSDKQDVSVAGWFNADSGGDNDQWIFSKEDTNEGGYEVFLDSGILKFRFIDDDGDSVDCTTSSTDLRDGNWHHFAGTWNTSGSCELYLDGTSVDTDSSGSVGHEHENDDDLYIGHKISTAPNAGGFEGYIDDIMYWNDYELTSSDVTALYEYSFGDNAHQLNFFVYNATGAGVNDENVITALNAGMPWRDQMTFTDVNDLYAGANFSASNVPAVVLSQSLDGRFNFTMSYSGTEDFNLWIDDSELDGNPNKLSSYLQIPLPPPPEILPTYYEHDNDNKVTLFIYNADASGAWLTYQGTRVIFNGTGGHFAGLINTVNNHVDPTVTISSSQDGPFIGSNSQADVVFWHPTVAPSASQPSNPEKIIPGTYQVSIYLNGYDEVGSIIVRSINMGNVLVVD